MSSDQFFSQRNEGVLQRALYSDICRRTGGDLNERQATRLMKTVKHYMGEVYRVRGDGTSVSVMNKEVLQIVLPDYLSYMERQALSSRSAVADIEIGPAVGSEPIAGTIEDGPRQQMDVGAAFSQLQTARQNAGKRTVPEMPEFRLSLSDEPAVSMDTFERMKKDREGEAARVALSQAAAAQGPNAFVQASDSFLRDRRRADEESEKAFADRERAQLEQRAAAAAAEGQLPMPPDMRSLFLGDRQNLSRTLNQSAGDPTLVGRSEMSGRQQMIITREPSSIEYKENELNLFVYSGDRDWISNSSETRYSFSVQFDPGNMPTGLRLSPTSTVKFKNIVRIEFVKAIMPGESVDTLITRTYNSGTSTYTYANAYNFNILSFPYIQVRIPELDNNTYGTNQGLNSAFGVLQYDANWIYDTSNTSARGYFAMIPKFLKCQKVYSPTPLATLQKLTFNFQRPDGTLVSTVPDTLDINYIYSSKEVTVSPAFPYAYNAIIEDGSSSAYYLIQTTTYFNKLTVNIGDRIQIANLAWTTGAMGAVATQLQDFLSYIQQSAGLIVVDVGYGSAGAGPIGGNPRILIGSNNAGYCNYIIVRGKFLDPTTGATATAVMGNIADATAGSTPALGSFTEFLSDNQLASGRLINQSHQVQVALRIITREMDSTSVLRPDNM